MINLFNMAIRGHYKSIKIEQNFYNTKILLLFEELGLIRGLKIIENQEKIEIFLKYKGSRSVVHQIKMISKSSRRVYVDIIRLIKLKERNSSCLYILSTNKGLKLDSECLINNMGGEVLMRVDF